MTGFQFRQHEPMGPLQTSKSAACRAAQRLMGSGIARPSYGLDSFLHCRPGVDWALVAHNPVQLFAWRASPTAAPKHTSH